MLVGFQEEGNIPVVFKCIIILYGIELKQKKERKKERKKVKLKQHANEESRPIPLGINVGDIILVHQSKGNPLSKKFKLRSCKVKARYGALITVCRN